MKQQMLPCIFLIILVSCQKEQKIPEQPVDLVEKYIADTSYGADPAQKIDIYLPAKRNTQTKTIILIHGGGWVEGDKSEWTGVVDGLKQQLPGYAIGNINYRLASANSMNVFPAQENDITSAIAMLQDKAEEFVISKELIIMGASAGAHLALLYSYKHDPDKQVKAVIDFFGPADLIALWNAGLIQQYIMLSATGKTYEQSPEIYFQSSPVNFITAQSPPTIVLQGGKDALVLPVQSTLLINTLHDHGVPNQLVFYPDEGHGWQGASLVDSYEKIKAFIYANTD